MGDRRATGGECKRRRGTTRNSRGDMSSGGLLQEENGVCAKARTHLAGLNAGRVRLAH
jgi:hypothetical protein